MVVVNCGYWGNSHSNSAALAFDVVVMLSLTRVIGDAHGGYLTIRAIYVNIIRGVAIVGHVHAMIRLHVNDKRFGISHL